MQIYVSDKIFINHPSLHLMLIHVKNYSQCAYAFCLYLLKQFDYYKTISMLPELDFVLFIIVHFYLVSF